VAKRPQVSDDEGRAKLAALGDKALDVLATRGIDLRGLNPDEMKQQLKRLTRKLPPRPDEAKYPNAGNTI
jgi:hypothetical protein